MAGPTEGAAISLPLRLTYLRIVLVPAVLALILLHDRVPHAFGYAAVVFTLAALTDFFDGFLARRWRITTALGAFLDTTADKLLVTGALLGLLAVDRVSAWVALVIIGRELVVMALRGLAAVDQVVVMPSVWGKLKANVQYVAIVMALLRTPAPAGPLYPDEWAMIAAAVVTVISGAEYAIRIWPQPAGTRDRLSEPSR